VPDLDASRTTIAARATIPTETMHNMPFHVDASMVSAAIVAADAAGRKAHATTRIGL
jgi:glycerol dehydrogenase